MGRGAEDRLDGLHKGMRGEGERSVHRCDRMHPGGAPSPEPRVLPRAPSPAGSVVQLFHPFATAPSGVRLLHCIAPGVRGLGICLGSGRAGARAPGPQASFGHWIEPDSPPPPPPQGKDFVGMGHPMELKSVFLWRCFCRQQPPCRRTAVPRGAWGTIVLDDPADRWPRVGPPNPPQFRGLGSTHTGLFRTWTSLRPAAATRPKDRKHCSEYFWSAWCGYRRCSIRMA